jgi:hypothetical protein
LKCEPERALELRAEYEAINPGYHMSKIHWNTVDFNNDVSDKLMLELINHSYDLVFKKFNQKYKTKFYNVTSSDFDFLEIVLRSRELGITFAMNFRHKIKPC